MAKLSTVVYTCPVVTGSITSAFYILLILNIVFNWSLWFSHITILFFVSELIASQSQQSPGQIDQPKIDVPDDSENLNGGKICMCYRYYCCSKVKITYEYFTILC